MAALEARKIVAAVLVDHRQRQQRAQFSAVQPVSARSQKLPFVHPVLGDGRQARGDVMPKAFRMNTLEFAQIVERQKRPSFAHPVQRGLKVFVFIACGNRLSDLIIEAASRYPRHRRTSVFAYC